MAAWACQGPHVLLGLPLLQNAEWVVILRSTIYLAQWPQVFGIDFYHLESVSEAARTIDAGSSGKRRAGGHAEPKCGSYRNLIAIFLGPYKSGSASSLCIALAHDLLSRPV
jgi:hypothetical protein